VKAVRSETRQDLLAWQQTRGEAPSLEDLLARVRFRRREIEALLWSGALDEIAGLCTGDYPWVHQALWGELSRGGASALERTLAEARLRIPSKAPRLLARYSGLCRVQGELRFLEMHVSDHPLRLLRTEADQLSCVTSERLGGYVDQIVSFAGIVAATRNVGLVEGGAVQFITLEDEHGLVEARLAPEEWKRFHPLLATPGPYLLRGRVQRRQGALYLDIRDLLPFHERGTHLPVSACGAATGLD
jgi:DNA polymerase III alpha subunit